MAKRALCVGINDYPYTGSDLRGCVNDANAWAELLSARFDFPAADVRIVTNADATKRRMVDALKRLLANARSGDVLVFTNSSHGTYVAEAGGDEAAYDEAICPHDVADNLLVDDELRELLAGVPRGVRVTVISDSCFSGTVTRAPQGAADERRPRFLSPAVRGGRVLADTSRAAARAAAPRARASDAGMREVLLSGADDNEFAYDALIGGRFHGAMTHSALRAIREAGDRITYEALHARVAELLDEGGYPQHAQLEGAPANLRRQIFT